jgi:hypothetical protein
MIKATNTLSIIHSLIKLGINFLKIRSETNAIIAVSKLNPTIRTVASTCPGLGDFSSNRIITALTTQIAETIFRGVNFSFKTLTS